MGYTKQQGQHFKDRYHNDPEFRNRILKHIHNSQMRYPFRTWANKVIQGHRKREYPLEITRPELEEMGKQHPICAYCGRTLKYGIQNGKKKWHHDSASIDVIDIAKPSTKDNLQIICVHCNSAKARLNDEKFKDWIKQLYFKFFGPIK